MPEIYELIIDGKPVKVEFDGTPTDADIDEAVRALSTPKQKAPVKAPVSPVQPRKGSAPIPTPPRQKSTSIPIMTGPMGALQMASQMAKENLPQKDAARKVVKSLFTEKKTKPGLFAVEKSASQQEMDAAIAEAKRLGVEVPKGGRKALQNKAVWNLFTAKIEEALRPISDPLGTVAAITSPLPISPDAKRKLVKTAVASPLTGYTSAAGSASIFTAPDATANERIGSGLELARDLALAFSPQIGGALKGAYKQIAGMGDDIGEAITAGAKGVSGVPKPTIKAKAVGRYKPSFDTPKKAPGTPIQASTKTPPVESPPKVETPSTVVTEPGMGKSTGVSHAEVDKVRESIGWRPRSGGKKTDPELIEEAKKYDGQEDSLASRILDDKDAKNTLSDPETLALGKRLNKLIDDMGSAKKSDDFDAYETADVEAQRIADALDKSGSEQGRAFRARQFLFENQTDPWIVRRKLKKMGVNDKRIEEIVKQLEETKVKLGASETEVANLNKQLLNMEAETIIRNASKKGARRGNIDAIKKENSDLWAALTKSSAKVSAGVDIETAKVFAKLVTNTVKLGAATVDDAIRTVIEEAATRGFTVTPDDIYAGQRENLAGRAVTRTEAQKQVAKLQAELNKKAKDAAPGADAAKEAKRLDDIRTQIAELERQIKDNNFPPKGKDVKAKSRLLELKEAELKQLRAEVRGIIKAAEPRSAMGKVNELARESQLANPIARIVDITANTTKMASYAATNPLRSILSSVITPKTVGRERFLFTPTKFKAVFDNAPARWKAELKGVLKGADFETIEKYGHPSGWFSRLAGASDVVFKDVYARLAYDDYALGAGKALGLKGKELAAYRAKAFKQLVRESAEGPLTEEEFLIARATAQDWAARQTFNVENMASKSLSALKGGVGGALDKEFGKNAGDSFKLAVDTFTRFSKVIGNVALERLNYSEAGIAEALVRGVVSKSKNAGKIPLKDARLISDLAIKGLSGLATIELGKQAYGWLKDQDWLKGEIVTTAGGTKFVKWTVLPDVGGGLDADQFGGLAAPLLYGATQQMIEESGLTEKQKAQLWKSYSMGQKFNQPLLSGMGSFTDIFDAKGKDGSQIGANIAARALIPSGVNEIGTRMDKMRTGTELRKASTPLEEFVKRIPVWRETLKRNEK